MKRLRIGFVGGGWVSLNRHMPAAKSQPNLDLVGLITTERTLSHIDRPMLSQRFGLRNFGVSLEEMWVDDLDALIIGTPPTNHYQIVLQALHMGKHVLVEKPFTLDRHEAAELVKVAQDRRLQLGLVHNLQFSSAMQKARALLDRGAIGALRGVIGVQSSNHFRRLPSWYKTLPLGLFTDESPHLIYLMRHFLPEAVLENVFVGSPLDANDRTPQSVSANFVDPQGRVGTLQMVFTGSLSEWHVLLLGESRMILVDLFRDTLIVLPNDRRHQTLDVARTSLYGITQHLLGYLTSGIKHLTGTIEYGNHEVFRRFTHAVLGEASLEAIDAAQGQWVAETLHTITDSAKYHPEP